MGENQRVVFTVIMIAMAWSATGVAQDRNVAPQHCPAGYLLMESLCWNKTTGDVVMAAEQLPAHEPGCRPGYWRLDALCHSPSTGDVELIDEVQWPKGNSGRP